MGRDGCGGEYWLLDSTNGSATGNAALGQKSNDTRYKWLDVQLSTLDSFVPSLNLTRLDFMKVDIEGHEDMFFRGAAGVFKRFRPVVLVEINNCYYEQRGVNPTAVFQEWMRQIDYCPALKIAGKWTLGRLEDRVKSIDDVFALPRERAAEILARLQS